jgi:hypothetical protein
MQKTNKKLSEHRGVAVIGALACLVAILVFITGKENLTKILNLNTPTEVPPVPVTTQMLALTEGFATPSAIPPVNELPGDMPTALPTLYTLTQQEYTSENWFGRNTFYGNAEDGQSFRVAQASELREIAIHLAYRPGGNNERPIRCSLMDSGFNILAESEIDGFQGDGGWKSFRFDPGVSLQPGTYIFSVFTQGSYLLRFTDNPRSYLDGERYIRTWKDSDWESSDGDLSFSIFLTTAQPLSSADTAVTSTNPPETTNPFTPAQPSSSETVSFDLEGGGTDEMLQFGTAQEALRFIAQHARWHTGATSVERMDTHTDWLKITPESSAFFEPIHRIPGLQPKIGLALPPTGEQFFVLNIEEIGNGTVLLFESLDAKFVLIYVAIPEKAFEESLGNYDEIKIMDCIQAGGTTESCEESPVAIFTPTAQP